jgi:hypothetical protein
MADIIGDENDWYAAHLHHVLQKPNPICTNTVNLCIEWHPRLIYHAEYRTAFHKKALYDAISQEKMYQAHITYLEGEQEINRP